MIERHVCSLALSRKLAEAGFLQECVFAWRIVHGGKEVLSFVNGDPIIAGVAAPLLSEIMEQMPPGTEARAWRMLDGQLAWSALARFYSPGTVEEVQNGGPTGQDAAGALWLALRGEK